MSELKNILKMIQNKEISLENGERAVSNHFFSDNGSVKIDNNRKNRCGFAEVIYCPNKSASQLRIAAEEILKTSNNLIATRATEDNYQTIKEVDERAKYSKTASLVYVEKKKKAKVGNIVVVSAGTADTNVAEEAAITAQINGANVHRIYDAGVAGIHRLLYFKEELSKAKVVVAVAGMEGALASVVGGLVSCPVIAVPTSVGYGSSFEGLSALLTMLNSCAPNISVVNIDNGFGAGYIASLINRQSSSDSLISQLKETEKVFKQG